jgi:hypothetical protein
MRRYAIAVLVLATALSQSVSGQQQPKTAAEMAAEQAEAVARAQQKVAEESRRRAAEAAREDLARANEFTTIDVEVTISRYQADKKVSSLPFTLVVNAGHSDVGLGSSPANHPPFTGLRMGGLVPLPTMAPALGPDGKPVTGFTGGGPVEYRDVGTNIDTRARRLADGRFELFVSVEEEAIATPQGTAGTLPVIRTFKTSNTLMLRDGQTRQFTAAADRITGEVVRVDVTLKVAK